MNTNEKEQTIGQLQREIRLAQAIDDVLYSGDFGARNRPSLRLAREIIEERLAEFEKELSVEDAS